MVKYDIFLEQHGCLSFFRSKDGLLDVLQFLYPPSPLQLAHEPTLDGRSRHLATVLVHVGAVVIILVEMDAVAVVVTGVVLVVGPVVEFVLVLLQQVFRVEKTLADIASTKM